MTACKLSTGFQSSLLEQGPERWGGVGEAVGDSENAKGHWNSKEAV